MELHNFAILFRTALDAEQGANEYWSLLKNIDPQALNRSYAPPALTIPKPQPKERRIIPASVSIPFGVAPDDEDFDEENSGTEVEFLPNELHDTEPEKPTRDDNLFDNNKIKQKPKIKKEQTHEKITSISTRTENKPTPSKPTQQLSQKTQTASAPKNVASKKAELTNSASKVKVATTKTTPPVKKTTPVKPTQKELVQKRLDKKKNKKIDATKNSSKQNQKSTLKKLQKNSSQKNVKPDNRQDKKNTPKQTNKKHPLFKTSKTTNNKKQQPDKSAKKINNKQNTKNTKNNNKKIVRIVSKESKSVTKQLQKKRPK
jgi:hypothetical protein